MLIVRLQPCQVVLYCVAVQVFLLSTLLPVCAAPPEGMTNGLAVVIQAASGSVGYDGSFVDLGNPASEAGHDLTGWAGAWTNQPPSPSGDTTFQYQPILGQASLTLQVPETGVDYWVETEVQDFGCDDSFEVYANGHGPLYRFIGTQSNIVRRHSILVTAGIVPSTTVTITFHNIATDACGAAGVYNVAIQEGISQYFPVLYRLSR